MQTEQLLAAFERDGFVLIEGLMPQRQLADARAGVDWAMAQPAAPYKWIKQRTYEWLHEHPVFVGLMEHPLVLDFARAWLGPDFHLIATQCSRNTREEHYAPGAMKLHADAVLFPAPERMRDDVPPQRYGFSAMWYLQDTPLEMGTTELLPGSHLSDETFDNDSVDASALFRRPIPAGSLLIFNHRTWHRGALNSTDRPRDLITSAYGRPEVDKVQLMVPQEDGTRRYIAPEALLPELSPIMRQLLRPVS